MKQINRVGVPSVFRMQDKLLYPPNNSPDFEYWLSENIKDDEIKSDRIYLNVLWTSFYKNVCNYGNNKTGIKILQDYLDGLDKSKKYWTVVQFDDGIINDISHLDIKVFSMAGGKKDYGLPLICQPHRIKFNNPRDIFCSFVGRITNPIRKEIVDRFSGVTGYYISTKHHTIPQYCKILSRSTFGLCPEGYGIQSFRIQECLEYGAIPVLISPEILPIHNLNFYDFGFWLHSNHLSFLNSILRGVLPDHVEKLQSRLKDIFENYFTFESNKRLIVSNMNE